MKVEDYKKRLKELGIPEEYIEYPGVTGGLLKRAMREKLSFRDFDDQVSVIGENYFRIGDREVTLTEKNKILIKVQQSSEMKSFITLDEHGFEKETYDIFPRDNRRILRRTNGVVTVEIYRPESGWMGANKYFDTGRISLIGFECTENSVPRNGNESVDRAKLLDTFDKSRDEFLKLYPHLSDYYDELRKRLEERIAEINKPLKTDAKGKIEEKERVRE